jgi:lipopolysaccharide/colanic/teichoic acid biosynthesis glycosyltransferase/glycosyltransferase involved in cell wall biosynthesis
MKVVVLSSLAYSLVNFRGALLSEMVAAGHDVIACAPDVDADSANRLSAIGVSFQTVRMARTGTNPLDDLVTLWDMATLLRRERPDVVLAYTQKPIIYGGIAARLVGGTRFFAMCSGLGHAYSGSGTLRARLLRGIVSALYRVAVARAEAVLVFNRDDADEMRRHGILAEGQDVIQVPGSGIDTNAFQPVPVPSGPPTFLLIARLMRDKGLGEFAAAAREVRKVRPDARFQILGPFDANPSSISAEELKAWGEEGLIEYLGETRDVRPYLANCTAFVLPTYYREGLPRTILEAMASGRAIVTTDMPGCRETVLTDRNGILVQPRDVASLAGAMLRLATEDGLAQRYGAASRAIAVEQFDVRKVNALLLQTMSLARNATQQESAPARLPAKSSLSRRILDMVAAAAGLVTLSPLVALAAFMTWVGTGSPVLFRQQRAGLAGRPFKLVKFRTMTDARDAAGNLKPDAERVTATGRFLRRTRLDELPQLWNVMRGDMSLFGPRPLLPETIAAFGDAGAERCTIRPGLTGWAQIHGGPLLEPEEKLALDLWYVRNRNWKLDLSILLRTFAVLLRDDRVDTLEIGRAHASVGGRRG